MRIRRTVVPLAVLAVAAALAGCGGGSVLGADDTGPVSTPAPATTAVPATTTPSTSVPPATTSAPASTTTTTSTSTTSTTTTTVPAGDPLLFLPDGLNIVDFGATPQEAIGAVRDHLGAGPDFDSGWGPAWGDYGACPGTEYRQVRFGGLTLGFTDDGLFAPAGTRHFYSWYYDGTPAGITPPGEVTVGTTRADLQAQYPAAAFAYDDLWFGHTFRFETPTFGEQLWGTLTGDTAGDTVTYLVGGIGCGE